ncbi:hypothetical protein DV702_12915 [Sporosarcina sp. PTS2304]|uniref:hypothetical protein n=1 Tax=Sporosarcina sp. PTS2304 TaxID=2283194 RepID=UPI000E0D1F7F|nr:hypothetical protein [Sporosarcina sp. PTS2304]AXI00542.1 hypothetical protein DV702_12915 [Sporosarcina sp. PTS2304]
MQVLLHEIRKILTWKMLILLILVNWIVFFLFVEYDIKNFATGKNDSYHIGVEMVNKYGTDMDENDFLDFKNTYEKQIEKANHYLQSKKEFVDAGIKTYTDFLNMDWDNEKHHALFDMVMHQENIELFWELQERTRLIEFYEGKEASMEFKRKNVNTRQQVRYDELIEAGHYQVYPGVAAENFERFISNVAIAIILSVVLVISPVFINDRSRRLPDLQYTTKKGRNLYKTKAAAGLISAFIVMTILLIIYFSLFSLNGTYMFFKVPLHMFIGPNYWYDPTLFRYIVLTVFAIYIIGFIIALLAMSFSSIMPNYISLIGIQIPFVMAMLMFGLPYLIGHIISISVPQWVVPSSYSVMVVSSAIFIVLLWKREKKRDVVL